MAGNPDQGFLCQKTIRKEYDDDVNLWMERERERRKKKRKTTNQITALSFVGSWWTLGVTGVHVRGDELGVTGSFNFNPTSVWKPLQKERRWAGGRGGPTPPRAPAPPSAGCSCACRTRCCRSWRLPGWTSRTLCHAWTEPGTCHTRRSGWGIGQEREKKKKKSPASVALTRLRCGCLRPWPRCGAAWWWSQSGDRCWVRSLLCLPRLSPEVEKKIESIWPSMMCAISQHREMVMTLTRRPGGRSQRL